MPSSTLRHASSEAALWIGLAAGPLAWAALLGTNYILSYVACEQRHSWMLHTASLIAVAPPFDAEEQPSTNPKVTSILGERFLAISALALCAGFLIAIVALEIPPLVLGPCQ
jgi:hypothetical protein